MTLESKSEKYYYGANLDYIKFFFFSSSKRRGLDIDSQLRDEARLEENN